MRSNELWALMKLEEGIFLEWWACKNEERSKIIYAEYLEVVRRRTALAEKEAQAEETQCRGDEYIESEGAHHKLEDFDDAKK